MTDPWPAILEALKADIASLREQGDFLLEQRERVPKSFSSADEAERAEKLLAAVVGVRLGIAEKCRVVERQLDGARSLFDRSRGLWMGDLMEFGQQLELKIKQFRKI